MKTNLLLYLIMFLLLGTLSAQERGATPANHSTIQPSNHPTNTYAVVVGISDYQAPQITDLKYAHRDAEAFANYLRSPAGGSLDQDHLKLLINEQATAGQVHAALYWLLENCTAQDQAVIYFSGHGDVEQQLKGQPGYLLCWNSPPSMYMAGGSVQLNNLQTVISTLSLNIKAKVLIITDACRSGKLSGSAINGAQLTNIDLARQYASEIKILSCQPDEFSIEGEQWGGGRGVFSYHLVEGLYGLADSDQDLSVNLFEIGRYLQDHVSKEAAPLSQLPLTVGNSKAALARIYPDLLDKIREDKAEQTRMFSSTETKGIEEETLARLDSTTNALYHAFKEALRTKRFISPGHACADTFYRQLLLISELKPLHAAMRRNYAAALQDEAQEVLNKWLLVDVHEVDLPKKLRVERYQHYPTYLGRAAELLGPSHYMYSALIARKLFFEGYLMAISNRTKDPGFGSQVLARLREAQQWDSNMVAHVYFEIMKVHGKNLRQLDSAQYYFDKVTALSPTWVLPHIEMYWISKGFIGHEKSEKYLGQAMQIDSSSAYLYNTMARIYDDKGQDQKTEQAYQMAIRSDSSYRTAYMSLGYFYTRKKMFSKARQYLEKAITLDTTDFRAYHNLGFMFVLANECEKAVEPLMIAISKAPESNSEAMLFLADCFIELEQYEAAEAQLSAALALPLDRWVDKFTPPRAAGLMGDIKRIRGEYQEAETRYLEALELA
ncbi:MAG: hypothetical protein EP344_09445, partial [Bacteroidetes bacterium]